MRQALEELAELAKGATEREIETEVVHLLKEIGWLRSQIKQDFSISDKGTDRADIVLRLDGFPMVLVEVKKHGQLRDVDNQVNRYCRLLSPSPKLAILTDGVQWVLYYVGQVGAVVIQEATVPGKTTDVITMLTALDSGRLSSSLQAGAFQYLDIVEEGLRGRSGDTQKHLRDFFTLTVKTLLMPNETSAKAHPPKASLPVILAPRLHSNEEQTQASHSVKRVTTQQSGDALPKYDPFHPPPLGFMAHIAANFSGNTAGNWSDLLRTAVKSALEAGKTPQDIRHIANVNVQEGRITVKGYSHIPGTNVSIQGQSADQSWQNSLKLAQARGCVIEANFRWHDDTRASHPGECGFMRWQP